MKNVSKHNGVPREKILREMGFSHSIELFEWGGHDLGGVTKNLLFHLVGIFHF